MEPQIAELQLQSVNKPVRRHVKSKFRYPFAVGVGSKPTQMIAIRIRVGLEPTPTVTDCNMM